MYHIQGEITHAGQHVLLHLGLFLQNLVEFCFEHFRSLKIKLAAEDRQADRQTDRQADRQADRECNQTPRSNSERVELDVLRSVPSRRSGSSLGVLGWKTS